MRHYRIRNHSTGETIFEGRHASVRHCAEQAVQDGMTLDNADLRRANPNLTNAMLDGASLQGVCLSGANLMGANLSEARLDEANFENAGLQNACLCFSSLRSCNFADASFGATDIAGCDISHSAFSTLSAFSLNFTDAAVMAGCRYEDCPMARPPIVIQGLSHPIIILDQHVRIGSLLIAREELFNALNDNKPGLLPGADGACHSFIQAYRKLLYAFSLGCKETIILT